VDGGVGIAVWAAIALVLLGIEVATLGFIALYLAVGAVAAAIAAAVGADAVVQVPVFAIATVASLVLTRKPLLRAMKRMPQVPSNAPTVIGKRAVVTVAIEEGPGQRGQVRIGTEYWSARAHDEEPVPAGTTVTVDGLDGVTAVVRAVTP
jgi:membrane protein implicated in regulation of membrane protease activity